MKEISALLFFALFSWGTISSGTALPQLAFARAIDKSAQLELTISIIEQYSCAPDLLALHLRLTYNNTGKEPIILDRASTTIVDRYMVSRTMKDAAIRKYAQEVRTEDFGGDYGIDVKAALDLSHFAIIRPGETYSVDGPWTTASLVVNNGALQTKGALVTGTYFLQVQVDTWSYSLDVRQLRIKWQDHGYLWSQSLTSVPMPFTIESQRSIRKCI